MPELNMVFSAAARAGGVISYPSDLFLRGMQHQIVKKFRRVFC